MIADIAEELRQGLEQAWAKRLQHERAAAALRSLIDGYETALEALGEDPQIPSRASVESDRPVLGAAVDEAVRLNEATTQAIRRIGSTAPAVTPHENAKAWAGLVDNVRKSGKRATSTPAEPTKKRNTKPGRPMKVDHAEVANVAREAIRGGLPLTSTVADHFGISPHAASQRIAKARAVGHNIPQLVTRKASARPAGATKGAPITVEDAAALIEDGAA